MHALGLTADETTPTLDDATASKVRLLKILVVVGMLARLIIWLISDGSNDARTWLRFAEQIDERGLLGEYVANSRFNHPPLMGLWAVFAHKVALGIGVPFVIVFKALPLAADVASLPLIMRALRRRGASLVVQWQGAAVFSTAVVSILISAYHGNTDNLCAFLVLIAVLLVDDGDHPVLAGFAFAAALNVKLIPLVLAPALFVMQAKSIKHAVLFMLALGIGMTPFIPPIVEVGPAFYKNAIAYNSSAARWGFHYAMMCGEQIDVLRATFKSLDRGWAFAARYVIILSSFSFAVRARWLQARGVVDGVSALEVGAAAMTVFLVLAPGIGVQYFCFPLALIILVDRRRGLIYGLVAGVFIAAVYISFGQPGLPLASLHRKPFGNGPAIVGIATWFVLAEFLVAHLRRRLPTAPREDHHVEA